MQSWKSNGDFLHRGIFIPTKLLVQFNPEFWQWKNSQNDLAISKLIGLTTKFHIFCVSRFRVSNSECLAGSVAHEMYGNRVSLLLCVKSFQDPNTYINEILNFTANIAFIKIDDRIEKRAYSVIWLQKCL